MSKITQRVAAIAVAVTLSAAGVFGAQAAYADEVTPTPTIALLDQSDSPITSGSIDDSRMFAGTTVSTGCPVGHRDGAAQVIAQGGVRVANVAQIRNSTNGSFGELGLNGAPISLLYSTTNPIPNNGAANRNLNDPAFASMTDGAFELRFYCFAVATSPDYVNDPWYTVPLVLDTVARTWSYPAAPVPPTTTSLTAAAQPDYSVQLQATIKDGGATATTAVGTVDFFEGGDIVCDDVVVTLGVADCTTPILTVGAHSFTAVFTSGNSSYAGSTSAPAVANVGGIVITGNVTVAIPAGAGLLTLTGTADVSLGTAVKDNDANVFTASGALGPLTVKDTRQSGSPVWNLNGQVGNLTSGANVIDKKYLGWVPSATGIGTAGPTVAPAAADTGLGVSRQLATGAVPVDYAVNTTVASATLNLTAPGNTPSGNYGGTLTITLI